jgi:hypothetical protein
MTQGDVRVGSEAQALFERTTDADTSAELKACAVFIESGTSHKDTAYVQTTDSPVLGTSNIVRSQFSSAGGILAGSGLSKSGNTISASVDDTFIEIEAGNLTVKSNSITADKVAKTLLPETKHRTPASPTQSSPTTVVFRVQLLILLLPLPS